VELLLDGQHGAAVELLLVLLLGND
jgi:hypothetical protein